MSRRARTGEDGTAKPAAARSAPAAKTKPKPAPKPRAATKPRATAPAKPAATSKASPVSPVPDQPAARPRAVRAGAANLKAPAQAERPAEKTQAPPSGSQLVGTVVQAAGELAQIGVTIGGQILKRAVDRLPRP